MVAWYALALVFSLVISFGIALLADALPASPQIDGLYQENEGSIHLLLVLLMTPPMLGLIALLSGIRRMRIREYLALKRPQPKETFAWLMGLLGLIGVAHAVLHVADYRPAVDYGLLLYTTSPLPLLLFVVCVAAPVLEEIWYRGFVFRGMAASKVGPLAAIVLTAALFALMHVHYEWPEKLVAFTLGLYLATVRWRSGSTVLAIFCHAGANLYFVVATATQMHWLGRTVPPL
jgi:membrane protease YdiL (CAAX protease family)